MPQELPPDFKQFLDQLEYNTLIPHMQTKPEEDGTTLAMVNLIAKVDQATFAKLPDEAAIKSSSALYACKLPRVCHISLILSFHPEDEIVLATGFNLAIEGMARDFAVLRRQEMMRIVVATDNDARIIHCQWKMEGIKLTELGKIVQSMGPCDWESEQHMNLVRALNHTYPTPQKLLVAQRDAGPLIEVTIGETTL